MLHSHWFIPIHIYTLQNRLLDIAMVQHGLTVTKQSRNANISVYQNSAFMLSHNLFLLTVLGFKKKLLYSFLSDSGGFRNRFHKPFLITIFLIVNGP